MFHRKCLHVKRRSYSSFYKCQLNTNVLQECTGSVVGIYRYYTIVYFADSDYSIENCSKCTLSWTAHKSPVRRLLTLSCYLMTFPKYMQQFLWINGTVTYNLQWSLFQKIFYYFFGTEFLGECATFLASGSARHGQYCENMTPASKFLLIKVRCVQVWEFVVRE